MGNAIVTQFRRLVLCFSDTEFCNEIPTLQYIFRDQKYVRTYTSPQTNKSKHFRDIVKKRVFYLLSTESNQHLPNSGDFTNFNIFSCLLNIDCHIHQIANVEKFGEKLGSFWPETVTFQAHLQPRKG